MFASLLAFLTLPISTEPAFIMAVEVEPKSAVLTARFEGRRPEKVPIIYCGYGNFWPEVWCNNRPVPLRPEAVALKEKLFRYRGGVRDYSFDILRSPEGPWRLGRFPLKELYDLKPGQLYWVRGIYENNVDVRRVTVISGFVKFQIPSP